MVLCLTGTGLIILGLIMAWPKVYKLAKCRNTINGKIVSIQPRGLIIELLK